MCKSTFLKTIILGGKNTEECVEIRVQNYDSLKTKTTTQSMLPDPESAKQHLQPGNLHCYQCHHCMDYWLTKVDHCSSGWTRNVDGKLVPLWFNGKQFPDGLMKSDKQKATVTPNPVCKMRNTSTTTTTTTTNTSIAATTVFGTCWKTHISRWYRTG